MNTTTREGFLMNTLRRIPRYIVKALAAGAVLIAATLPLAAATEASAAGVPTLGALWSGTPTALVGTIASSISTNIVTLTGANAAMPAGEILLDGAGNLIGVLAAPVAASATSGTLVSDANETYAAGAGEYIAPFSFGAGGLPAAGVTVYIGGSGFAFDNGNASIASSDSDLTFSAVTETSHTLLHATLKTTATGTNTGTVNVTLTDDNLTSAPLLNAFTVNPDPVVNSISPNFVNDGQTLASVTVTGSFALGSGVGAVALTNLVNGTSLELTSVGGTLGFAAGCTAAGQGNASAITASSFTFMVAGLNCATGAPATPGSYALTVTNADGGSVTTGAYFTVGAYGVFDVSPASVPSSTTMNVTLDGSGFLSPPGTPATVVDVAGGGAVVCVVNAVHVTSPTTVVMNVTAPAGNGFCNFTYHNGGTADTSSFSLGVGTTTGNMSPTITSVTSPAAALNVGALVGSAFTVSGFGFDPYNGETVTVDTGTGGFASGVTGTCSSDPTGTLLSCTALANNDSIAGPANIVVQNDRAPNTLGPDSNAFDNAVTVSGPIITATSPTTLAVGQAIGFSVALTGTGLTNTAETDLSGIFGPNENITAIAPHGVAGPNEPASLGGQLSAQSATAGTFVITSSPTAVGTYTVYFEEVLANGDSVFSTFPLTVGIPPAISAPYITYPTVNGVVTHDVGVGATSQQVIIYGSGFNTGVTIGSFTNSASAADANVTAKVLSVNVSGTQIIADIAIAAGDTNASVGYTVTNTNGSSVSVTAFSLAALAIGAAPTVTGVSPATATPSSTDALTITGTGFAAGATVTPSSGGTCGAATVVSATSITVSCTFGAAGAAAVTLTVANADGGSATSATVLPAAVTPPPAPKSPHATKVHGFAVVGKTVTMTISGTGFYGKPRVTSTGSGVRVAVSHDSGTLLTVRITVSAKGRMGEHTLTITDADGKSCRINYATK
jgi:hypothetical protein